MDKVTMQDSGGFYTIAIEIEDSKFGYLVKTFNMLCKRLLSSPYIPFSTPGIAGKSAKNICVTEGENFSLDIYRSMVSNSANRKSDNGCKHRSDSVGNIIGLAASTSFHNKRDGLDVQLQYKNPKDKTSPKLPRRPTTPQNICKTCALLSILGTWYATFFFTVSDQEIIVIPIPKIKITGSKLQEIFALQHQVRKNWFNQKIPQVLIPMVFLSRIPSSADILEGFDLFVAVLSRQRVYHVDGLFLIPIKNYLDFIGETPYNIATIDKMLNTFGNKRYPKEACDALMELNNAIYYRKRESLLKFARLYTIETTPKDSNKWVNLLYPETTKYLLKEVAMIRQEIIESSALASLARTLRYFIREKKYGYADDIRNARKESKDFEDTIAKMLREGRLRLEQKEKIHLPTDEEMKEVFKLANQDFEATKTALVILAFSFPPKTDESTNTTAEA
ncbi:MAG: type I-A CRISPR-associated protein Csa5 [Bacteroidales bacterium]